MTRIAVGIPVFIRDICLIRGLEIWRIAIGCGIAALGNPWPHPSALDSAGGIQASGVIEEPLRALKIRLEPQCRLQMRDRLAASLQSNQCHRPAKVGFDEVRRKA